jgi:protein TonB
MIIEFVNDAGRGALGGAPTKPLASEQTRTITAGLLACGFHALVLVAAPASAPTRADPRAVPHPTVELAIIDLPRELDAATEAPEPAIEAQAARSPAPQTTAPRRPRSASRAERPVDAAASSAPPSTSATVAEALAAASADTAPAVTAAPIVDFGDTLVVGLAESEARGSVEGRGAGHAEGAGDPSARVAGSAPDRSRAPRLAGGGRWDACGFPDEADEAGMNQAVVGLRVSVDADGTLREVDVIRDPGFGFGQLASRCARRSRWLPALDREGQPMAATHLLSVRFVR